MLRSHVVLIRPPLSSNPSSNLISARNKIDLVSLSANRKANSFALLDDKESDNEERDKLPTNLQECMADKAEYSSMPSASMTETEKKKLKKIEKAENKKLKKINKLKKLPILLINSIMSTVLPTPATPNSPIFPPR
ncbi:hypothetical protein LguiB_030878 [Lonicera macranthoides]